MRRPSGTSGRCRSLRLREASFNRVSFCFGTSRGAMISVQPVWSVRDPPRMSRQFSVFSPLFQVHAPLFFRMRRTHIRELVQHIGVGLKAGGRTLIFCQERDSVIDDVVSEESAVGILCGLGGIET